MIEDLKHVFALAEQRLEQEQQALAALLLAEIQAEERWAESFADPRSEALLDQLVAEALAQDAAGHSEETGEHTFL